MPHILIIEDEAAIADTLVFALETSGFSTNWQQQGEKGLNQLRDTGADLVILDVGLPDINGFEVCRQLRKFSEAPVMFLTARGEEIDRIVGLEIGADDYVVKPFSPREVVARVSAILKRTAHGNATNPGATESAPGFEVDNRGLQIRLNRQPLNLTPQEYRLLAHLLSQPRRVFSREQLLEALGVSTEASYDRAIDSHIKSIRAKLRNVDPQTNPIQTHRGFGYSYNPEQG